MPNTPVIISILAALLSGGIALYSLARAGRSFSNIAFSLGMLALALEAVVSIFSLQATSGRDLIFWENCRAAIGGFVLGIWLIFSTRYARAGSASDSAITPWKWTALAIFVLPLLLVVFFRDVFFIRASLGINRWALLLGRPGYLYSLICLLGAVLILVNLEKTLKASSGGIRWRIKFLVIGLGCLFAIHVYSASQQLLFQHIDSSLCAVNSGALLIADLLILFSMLRNPFQQIDIYISQQFLYNSFTVLIVGIYLFSLGVVAKIAVYFGAGQNFFENALLFAIMLAGTLALLFSGSVKQGIKRFISRHFQHPLYDYRKIWNTLTSRTTSLVNLKDLGTVVVNFIAESFGISNVTLWLLDDAGKLPSMCSSSCLSSSPERNSALMKEISFLMNSLRGKESPIDLKRPDHPGHNNLSAKSDPTMRYCVPLVAAGEFLGIMTLSDRQNGPEFSIEDFDLLKTIAEQTAVHILNVKLFENLGKAKEMEAFQNMSTFFVHDMKNLASTLSLFLQNLPVHYDNPEFRKDILEMISGSVDKIQNMCTRLSSLNRTTVLQTTEVNLNDLVLSGISGLQGSHGLFIEPDLGPVPTISVDAEQVQKVLLNLILNAHEATKGTECQIRVKTLHESGYVVISVIDNGCGMSREFLEKNLFKPFQTTKKSGLGIGLFQCKMIVEAHRGKIEVESEEGKGSNFRILLPDGIITTYYS
jgi:putative PEP-CTERM system histidine kinase